MRTMPQLKFTIGVIIIASLAVCACSGPRLGGVVERSAFSGELKRATGLSYARSIRVVSPSIAGRMRPSGVAELPNEELILVDRDRGRAGLFSSDGVLMTFLEAPGAFRASEVALGPGMTVYVLDTGDGAIYRFESTGQLAGQAYSSPGGERLVALCFDKLGTAYLSDAEGDEILVLDSAYTLGVRWGGFGTGPGMFVDPAGLDVDERNRVYVCDSGNSRIQVLDQWGAVLAVWPLAEDGTRPVPEAIAVDSWGNSFVNDTGCRCLRVLDASGTQTFRLDVGLGEAGFMSSARGVEVADGALLVADENAGEIQVFNIVYEK
jgi:DNA-binding beta-propeller fold protein YncE